MGCMLYGIFGFLHSGEFTCPSSGAYNEDMLSVGDVYVDSNSKLFICVGARPIPLG